MTAGVTASTTHCPQPGRPHGKTGQEVHRVGRRGEGFFITEAADKKDFKESTATITEARGTVEKIESRYSSLEEMLLKIGNQSATRLHSLLRPVPGGQRLVISP